MGRKAHRKNNKATFCLLAISIRQFREAIRLDSTRKDDIKADYFDALVMKQDVRVRMEKYLVASILLHNLIFRLEGEILACASPGTKRMLSHHLAQAHLLTAVAGYNSRLLDVRHPIKNLKAAEDIFNSIDDYPCAGQARLLLDTISRAL